MESNRKRRGFIKGKLAPFYRVNSKPSSTSATTTTTTTTSKQSSMQYVMSSKVKPSQAYPLPSSVGFIVHNHKDYHVIIATQAQAQPKQKITFIVPPSHADRKQQQQLDQHNLADDEMVDMKAATYISSVQERFKLERNS